MSKECSLRNWAIFTELGYHYGRTKLMNGDLDQPISSQEFTFRALVPSTHEGQVAELTGTSVTSVGITRN